ncbi:hypothetical protein LTR04_006072 [Oleoguttula sp. CCFEE 6159]|nr:hypothetical protein LTR04_006072 [Oleoguttula sp. CCFEE 6159]
MLPPQPVKTPVGSMHRRKKQRVFKAYDGPILLPQPKPTLQYQTGRPASGSAGQPYMPSSSTVCQQLGGFKVWYESASASGTAVMSGIGSRDNSVMLESPMASTCNTTATAQTVPDGGPYTYPANLFAWSTDESYNSQSPVDSIPSCVSGITPPSSIVSEGYRGTSKHTDDPVASRANEPHVQQLSRASHPSSKLPTVTTHNGIHETCHGVETAINKKEQTPRLSVKEAISRLCELQHCRTENLNPPNTVPREEVLQEPVEELPWSRLTMTNKMGATPLPGTVVDTGFYDPDEDIRDPQFDAFTGTAEQQRSASLVLDEVHPPPSSSGALNYEQGPWSRVMNLPTEVAWFAGYDHEQMLKADAHARFNACQQSMNNAAWKAQPQTVPAKNQSMGPPTTQRTDVSMAHERVQQNEAMKAEFKQQNVDANKKRKAEDAEEEQKCARQKQQKTNVRPTTVSSQTATPAKTNGIAASSNGCMGPPSAPSLSLPTAPGRSLPTAPTLSLSAASPATAACLQTRMPAETNGAAAYFKGCVGTKAPGLLLPTAPRLSLHATSALSLPTTPASTAPLPAAVSTLTTAAPSSQPSFYLPVASASESFEPAPHLDLRLLGKFLALASNPAVAANAAHASSPPRPLILPAHPALTHFKHLWRQRARLALKLETLQGAYNDLLDVEVAHTNFIIRLATLDASLDTSTPRLAWKRETARVAETWELRRETAGLMARNSEEVVAKAKVLDAWCAMVAEIKDRLAREKARFEAEWLGWVTRLAVGTRFLGRG